jgi:hypothetical protein
LHPGAKSKKKIPVCSVVSAFVLWEEKKNIIFIGKE